MSGVEELSQYYIASILIAGAILMISVYGTFQGGFLGDESQVAAFLSDLSNLELVVMSYPGEFTVKYVGKESGENENAIVFGKAVVQRVEKRPIKNLNGELVFNSWAAIYKSGKRPPQSIMTKLPVIQSNLLDLATANIDSNYEITLKDGDCSITPGVICDRTIMLNKRSNYYGEYVLVSGSVGTGLTSDPIESIVNCVVNKVNGAKCSTEHDNRTELKIANGFKLRVQGSKVCVDRVVQGVTTLTCNDISCYPMSFYTYKSDDGNVYSARYVEEKPYYNFSLLKNYYEDKEAELYCFDFNKFTETSFVNTVKVKGSGGSGDCDATVNLNNNNLTLGVSC